MLVDAFQHVPQIQQHLIIPETQNAKASLPQEAIAASIICSGIQMLASIKLDDHCRLRTDEVADVGTSHVLAPELEAGQLATAQAAPKQAFGVCQVLTMIAGVVEHRSMASRRHDLNTAPFTTYTCYLMTPPPLRGTSPRFAQGGSS